MKIQSNGEEPGNLVSALGNIVLESSPVVEWNFSISLDFGLYSYILKMSGTICVQCHTKLYLRLVSWGVNHLQGAKLYNIVGKLCSVTAFCTIKLCCYCQVAF